MSKLMFKGFDKNLKCRNFQYEVGKEYIHDGNIKVCESGFHACENPMDVFEYYPPNKARYCEVTGDGKESSDEDGKKTSFEKIKINAEIGLGGIIKAGIKFCFDRVKWTKENTATGDYSGAVPVKVVSQWRSACRPGQKVKSALGLFLLNVKRRKTAKSI